MRALLVTALLIAAVLAGCSDDGLKTPGDGDVDAPASGHPVWVHRNGGIPVDATLFNGTLPSFEQRHVTTRISGEPTIAISRTGAVFYPAIDFDSGVPNVQGLPRTVYFRSVDGGTIWEDYSPHLLQQDTHPTSFDPYIYGDPTTGRIFALDMGPHVACNQVSWSDDDGRTWITRPAACPTPVADHPSIFTAPGNAMTQALNTVGGQNPLAYPNTIFLCSNQIADVQCSMSVDGGLNWLPSQPVFVGYDVGAAAEGGDPLDALCGSLTGHGHASFVDGTIYIGRAYCGTLVAGISRDGGLNWEQSIIASDPRYAPRGEHDVSIATDLAGNAYALWIGDEGRTVFLAQSSDQGRTWAEPLNVTAPGVTAAKLPSLVAGAAGRIAWQYVATTTPSGWTVEDVNQTTGERDHQAEWLNATWNAYVGVSLDATTTDPVFATTTVNDVARPLKRGGCEGRCPGADSGTPGVGGMYDFLDIDFDPVSGRLWTAIVDVCTAECDEPTADAETFERSFGAVGKQIGGTFLLDEPYPAR
ncbi:MAG: sialidase family protein [Candidatus Thermoplasmatota archaeon]